MTLVIIRDDLVARTPASLATMLQYGVHVENKSMYNTPPVFGVYIMRLVLKWLLKEGGLAAIDARNARKADKLYAEIDRTGYYRGHAHKDSRSRMNVTFRLPSEELEKKFAKEATAAGLDGLKGHRSVGGITGVDLQRLPRGRRRCPRRVHEGIRAGERLRCRRGRSSRSRRP